MRKGVKEYYKSCETHDSPYPPDMKTRNSTKSRDNSDTAFNKFRTILWCFVTKKHYRIVLLRSSSSLSKNETADKLRASDLDFHSSREVSKNVRFSRFLCRFSRGMEIQVGRKVFHSPIHFPIPLPYLRIFVIINIIDYLWCLFVSQRYYDVFTSMELISLTLHRPLLLLLLLRRRRRSSFHSSYIFAYEPKVPFYYDMNSFYK